MTPIALKKTAGEIVRDAVVENAPDIGVYLTGNKDALVERVKVRRSPRGFKFHNCPNLTLRHCETEDVAGDGIYVTRSLRALIENNLVGAVGGKGADCLQLAYENDDSNISEDVIIRGNVFLQTPESSTNKGALVLARTRRYLVENNYIGGKNFSFSSIGDDAIVRSNIMKHGRGNSYSFGYGIGDQVPHAHHHVYDNFIEDMVRGISLSGFDDGGMAMREGVDIHDNIIADCDIAFHADRPWSGSFRRNIIRSCKRLVSLKGNGGKTHGAIEGNYLNDGSFLNVSPPEIRVLTSGQASVSAGSWSSSPDELRYFWRDKGQDIRQATGNTIMTTKGMELSCVVLARKGDNWMLAVAEMAYNGFVPRAWAEKHLPWRQRYITI